MRATIIWFLLLFFTTLGVHAARDWAPGVSGKTTAKSFRISFPLYMRAGIALGGYSVNANTRGVGEVKVNSKGLQFLVAARVIEGNATENMPFALDLELELIPRLITVEENIVGDFDKGFLFAAQVMPVFRLMIPTSSDIVISPHFGIGMGVGYRIFEYGRNRSDTFTGWSLGSDVMFTNVFGLGLRYSKIGVESSLNGDSIGMGMISLGLVKKI